MLKKSGFEAQARRCRPGTLCLGREVFGTEGEIYLDLGEHSVLYQP